MDSNELLELSEFWSAKILLCAAELDMFKALKQPTAALQVAKTLQTDRAATTRLLDALVGMEILEKAGNKYCLASSLRALLLPGPQCVMPLLLHRATLWGRWSNLQDIVKSGQLGTDPGGQAERPLGELENFIGAMKVVGEPSAIQTAKALDLGQAETLLDIGGGPGVYAAQFAEQNPGLEVTILDLPRVCKIAKNNLAGSAVASRISFIEGNAITMDVEQIADAYGLGFDVVFLSNLIHGMGPEDVQLLFGKCAKWVKPGGKIVVKDFLLDDTRSSPPRATIFGINMLVCTPAGQCYTWSEIETWLGALVELGGMKPKMSRIELANSNDCLVIAEIPKM